MFLTDHIGLVPWLIAALALYIIFYLTRQPTRESQTGPPSWPFIGNPAILSKTKVFHDQLTEWSRQYGDFFQFKLGRSPVFVLSSPKVVDGLLVKRGSKYSSRPRLSNQASLITQNARIVALPYNDQWRKQRRLYHDLLGMQNSKIFMPFQEFESRQSLLNLLEHPNDFWNEVTRYSASVTCAMLLRCRFESSDALIPKKLEEKMALMFESIAPGRWMVDLLPILDRLPDMLAPWRREAIRIREQIMPFWRVFYNRIKERVEKGDAPECFLASILQDKKANVSATEAPHIIATTMAAGTDTTATTLQHFFRAAVLFPDVIKRAQKEIDDVVGPNRLPAWEDRANLPFIAALINETHRWASVTTVAFPHATSQDDTFRDCAIPKDAMVIGNVFAIHTDPNIFPRPDDFIPERYLAREDPRAVPDAKRMDGHYAFGFGRRECPGKHVADASLYIVISRLLWAFDIVGNREKPPPPGYSSGPVYGPNRFEASIVPRGAAVAGLIRNEAAINRPPDIEDSAVYESLIAGLP